MTSLDCRRVRILVAGALAGVVAAGCSDDPSVSPSINTESVVVETAPAPETTSAADASTTAPPHGLASTLAGPVVTADPSGGISETALVSGLLVLDGDCLLLRGDDDVSVPVWQSGTTWDSNASEVVLPDGGRVSIGDEVEAGGGGRPGGGLIREVSSLDGRKLAEECALTAGSGVFVIQSPVEVIVEAP
jgi:hypothetical protein